MVTAETWLHLEVPAEASLVAQRTRKTETEEDLVSVPTAETPVMQRRHQIWSFYREKSLPGLSWVSLTLYPSFTPAERRLSEKSTPEACRLDYFHNRIQYHYVLHPNMRWSCHCGERDQMLPRRQTTDDQGCQAAAEGWRQIKCSLQE